MSVVSGFYTNVINEVIESLKIQFNEEGIDPAVLNDLKEIWEKKLKDSGALDPVKHNVQSASHFSAIMQPSDMSRNNSVRMPVLSNPTSRLIKPSGQGSVMPEQNYSASRMTVPVIVQQGLVRQVPMVINPQHGLPMFSQYHNIINPNHGNQIITDNNVVNLRKNQVDGNDDGSSEDEEGDFVNVSEVDPQSVRPPMSNVPATPAIFKKETKEEETDEDFVEDEIENLNNHDLSVKHEQSDEGEDEEDDDEADEPQNEEEPLNSEDDISDDDPEKIFEADNVIVCQYEKVNRTRNKWKLNFVSGIANLQGKDSVFHKAVGEAEW